MALRGGGISRWGIEATSTMKPSLFLCLIALSPAPAATAFSAPSVVFSREREIEEVGQLGEPRRIRLGMKREEVRLAMQGKPDDQFSADIWVYWQFHRPADERRFSTLIVMFAGDRVHTFRLVDEKSARALLAEVRARERQTIARK
jgi:hypothetical protein